MNFTEDQKDFLKSVYNIDLPDLSHVLKVMDGYAKPGDTVYWHCDEGLKHNVGAEKFTYKWDSSHRLNMMNHPNLYSLKEPRIVSSYSIDY